jgi:hypothetical protein
VAGSAFFRIQRYIPADTAITIRAIAAVGNSGMADSTTVKVSSEMRYVQLAEYELGGVWL